LSARADEGAKGVRVSIKKGGCAGMEYTVDLVTEPDAEGRPHRA
jgi:iron-sulfur cluster assembly protein